MSRNIQITMGLLLSLGAGTSLAIHADLRADRNAPHLHMPGHFDHYIVQEVGFSATQKYLYYCPYVLSFSTDLAGPLTISRDVKQVIPDGQPCAKYTVTKLGYKASFIPSQITTCDPQLPGKSSELGNAAYQSKKSPVADSPPQSFWKITARPVSDAYSLGEPVFLIFKLQI